MEAFIAAFKKHYGKIPHAKPSRQEKSPETIDAAGIRERFKPTPPEPDLDNELFKGYVRILVPLSTSSAKLEMFSRHLKKIEGLKIVIVGSDEKEGHFIVVSLDKEMALMRSVSLIPSVTYVARKGKGI